MDKTDQTVSDSSLVALLLAYVGPVVQAKDGLHISLAHLFDYAGIYLRRTITLALTLLVAAQVFKTFGWFVLADLIFAVACVFAVLGGGYFGFCFDQRRF